MTIEKAILILWWPVFGLLYVALYNTIVYFKRRNIGEYKKYYYQLWYALMGPSVLIADIRMWILLKKRTQSLL